MRTLYLAVLIFFLSVVPVFPADVVFMWLPNPDSDLAGYYLYQDGVQVAEVGAGTETVTVYGLPNGTYHFWLTAFDTNFNESVPNAEAIVVIDDKTPPTMVKGMDYKVIYY